MNGQSLSLSIGEFEVTASDPPPVSQFRPGRTRGTGKYQKLITELGKNFSGQWMRVASEVSATTCSTFHALKKKHPNVEVTTRVVGRAKVDGKIIRSFDVYLKVN